MPRRKLSLTVKSIDCLRELYKQLADLRRPYCKSRVRVVSRRDQYEETVFHEDPDVISIKKGYHQPLEVTPVEIVDSAGHRHRLTSIEYTVGSLYAPLASGNRRRGLGLEAALNFKIDCDLAKKKTGSIDDAFADYADDVVDRNTPFFEAKRRRKKREQYRASKNGDPASNGQRKPGPGEEDPNAGRPRKTNTEDLVERYGNDPEAVAWVLAHSEALDAGDFAHEDYRPPTEQHATTIEAFAEFDEKTYDRGL
jgi:hypothetical protein